MANTKISALPAGAPAQSTDVLPVDRAGTNVSLQVADILANSALTGTPTAPTQTPLSNNTDVATTAYADAAVAVEKSRALAAEGTLVPQTTTVNGHALSSNVTVSASDISTGTLPFAQLPVLASLGGLPVLSGFSVITVNPHSFSFASGDNDFYTVPPGKRAFAIGFVFNPNVTSLTAIPKINLAGAGTRYRVNANATAAQNVAAVTLSWNGLIAEAGDIFSLNLSEGSVNVWVNIYQFDNTNALKSPRQATWINGTNTIYTVPGGKHAYLMTPIGQGMWTSGSAVGGFVVSNESGSSVAYTMASVPSGGSTATFSITASIGTGSLGGGPAGPLSLNAGDTITMTSTQTGQQLAWMTIVEL